jgi:PAS domain S-box-containing protein
MTQVMIGSNLKRFMLHERLLVWTTMTIASIAAFGYASHYHTESFGLLFLPIVLHLFYLRNVNRSTKRPQTRSIDSTKSAIYHISGTELKKLLEQKETAQHLIGAIDSIGNKNTPNIETPQLQGEAGQAIASLRNKLNALTETEQQRIWEAQGIALLSEIRKHSSDLQGYSNMAISHLVKYLTANLGTLFSQNDEGQLELLATYATGDQKLVHKKLTVESGSGLIGQCAVDRKMNVLNNIPANYIKIISGLGEATPGCIVIAPLLFREEVYGVLEIASFETLPSHKLDFLTKACDSIGLELFNMRSQERTRKVMVQSQEEELRKNLEDMKATQRQMLIKEEELSQQLNNTKRAMAMAEAERKKNEAILEGCMDAVISFNQQGTIEYFNKAAEEVFGMQRKYVVGAHVSTILNIRIEEDHNESIRIVCNTGAEVSLRTEVSTANHSGEEISLLLTATKVKTETAHLFTLFAQKVSVELF